MLRIEPSPPHGPGEEAVSTLALRPRTPRAVLQEAAGDVLGGHQSPVQGDPPPGLLHPDQAQDQPLGLVRREAPASARGFRELEALNEPQTGQELEDTGRMVHRGSTKGLEVHHALFVELNQALADGPRVLSEKDLEGHGISFRRRRVVHGPPTQESASQRHPRP